MSDPRADTLANPRPISQHRTPDEIAADEEGPIGHPDPEADVKHVVADGANQHLKKRVRSSPTPKKKGGKFGRS